MGGVQRFFLMNGRGLLLELIVCVHARPVFLSDASLEKNTRLYYYERR